jgi:hypothetical protein
MNLLPSPLAFRRFRPAFIRLLGSALLAAVCFAPAATAATAVLRVNAASSAISPTGTDWALAYPSLAGWSGGNRDSGDIDDAEAEKLSAVIVLRQDIYDHLAAVVADLAERLGRTGPDLATTQRLAAQRCARWLLAHIEPLRAGQGIQEGLADEGVATLVEEADELAARAHVLAPWRPAPTRLDGIPCRCGAVGTVHDHGDIRKCWRCARTYTDDEWAVLMKVLAHRFRDLEGQTA